jgi:hypothetical protein
VVAILVFLGLICFVLSAFPRLFTPAWVVWFNLGVAFLVGALLVSLGGTTIHVG